MLSVAILIAVFSANWNSETKQNGLKNSSKNEEVENLNLEKDVLPPEGVVLPARWGDLGTKMINAGVIDPEKFEALYKKRAASGEASLAPLERGGLNEEMKKLLYDSNNGNLKITAQNSGVILNLLWALGLTNKNEILEKGPMTDPRYGGAEGFASTGGWTLSRGNAMDHYSRHSFIVLMPEQQQLVERVSKNIFRPCCGNPTYFPDCNHGMAMLGLLELMASQNVSEDEMYKIALRVNSYWFPDTYLTIAKYFQKRGVQWKDIEPKEILGSAYSSASGFRQVLEDVQPEQLRGASCGT